MSESLVGLIVPVIRQKGTGMAYIPFRGGVKVPEAMDCALVIVVSISLRKAKPSQVAAIPFSRHKPNVSNKNTDSPKPSLRKLMNPSNWVEIARSVSASSTGRFVKCHGLAAAFEFLDLQAVTANNVRRSCRPKEITVGKVLRFHVIVLCAFALSFQS